MYRVKELAELSGVSSRTLRYYDKIGLLKPERTDANGYRVYETAQVDRLQQVLFYRELGVPLDEIRLILASPEFDRQESLRCHLNALLEKKEQLELLIQNVKSTLRSEKEGIIMSDKSKFEGFKKELIRQNEEKYGMEVVKKYGKEALEESNAKIEGMSQDEWQKGQKLTEDIFAALKAATEKGDPTCEEAQKAAKLHAEWLTMFWGKGKYSKGAHLCMAETYTADERFTAYYDENAGKGATKMLRDAIEVFVR